MVDPRHWPSGVPDPAWGTTPGSGWPSPPGWNGAPQAPAGNVAPPPGWRTPAEPWWAPASPVPWYAGGRRGAGYRLFPMTVGDLLDLTFQLFKANLGQVLPVLLVIVVPWEVLRAIAAPASSSLASSLSQFGVGGGGANGAGASAGPGALALVATIGLLLCQPVATGAVTRAVVARYRHDEVPGARGLLRGGRRWVPMVLLASVLGHLPIAVGFFVFFVPAVVFSVLWSVTAPVAAAEGLGPWRALGRSWHLVSGRFWQVLGNLLLGGTVILVAVYLLAAAPLAALDGLTSGRLAVDLGAVVSTFTAVFQLGLLGTFVALVYLNLRVRLEGLDLDALSAPATAAA